MNPCLELLCDILLILVGIIAILMIPLNTIRFFLCPPSLQGFFENAFPLIEAWSFIFCVGVISFCLLVALDDKLKKEEEVSDE